jgi:hypothetical protein
MSKNNSFDGIEKAIELIQQRMVALKTENTELRQQLTSLRNGHNILLEIAGQRFAFADDITEAASYEAVPTQAFPELPSTPPIAHRPDTTTSTPEEGIQDYPTIPRMKAQQVQDAQKDAKEKSQARPAFLEEIMIDEFAAAASTPLAVWTSPEKKPEPISEDQKETLRRELMGSFLLE